MDMAPVFYTVQKIDGDYAILLSDGGGTNQVARALLPIEIEEGTRLKCEFFSYSIID